ncbi:hypothetical protein SAMN04489760_11473 [Syntrophus gentianae]|uniref:Uncharacterized protein n=1 Tax=Syntrophus gentianae TaxID=43775 RepID=A0A1H7Y6V5_9BACT|nr:hypothetical protein [Syntrophus gentianae]SEM41723.1 hypothetical protein SAMN04489760_11473 [Syntrophus gentianae]
MSLSRITANSNAYQVHDSSPGFGQVRNGFRHLLRSINGGYLERAQLAYKDLSQTMPAVFDRFSVKLTQDYDAIGRALGEGNLTGARQAVVQLKQDLQEIGRTENLSPLDPEMAAPRMSVTAMDSIVRSYYSESRGQSYLGTRIDILI